MRTDLLSRRMFLQGACATTLAMPWLASLPARARAAERPATRFVFMGHYFGRDIDFWYPRDEARHVSAEGVLYSDLSEIEGEISHALGAAFDPIRHKITLVRGLDSLDFDNGHAWSQPLTASGTNPVPAFGYSLDAILEESPRWNGQSTKLPVLRTSASAAQSNDSYSFTSKRSYAQPIPPVWDPRVVYSRYFDPAGVAAAETSDRRKALVTNRVIEDFRTVVRSPRLAAVDRLRLDNYMSMLTSIEARLGLATPKCAAVPLGELLTGAEIQSAMIDLEVAALACGLTNVVCHAIHWFGADPLGSGAEYHGVAHSNGLIESSTEPGVSQHATYDRWVMARVAEMLAKLDACEEPDGSRLLDNVVFLYANSDSRGFHSFYDMPVLLAGGRGRLNLGRYIDYRPRPLRVIDAELGLIAGRPYNNLLVTLFNALGLEASDYQKFGQVGFGTYAGFSPSLHDHYAPFLGLAQLNAPLPFLYKG